MEILKVNYTSRDEAAQKIPAAFAKYYQDKYPGDLRAAPGGSHASATQVLAVWNRNIFPEMKVTWGTYPINIGHTDFPAASAATTAPTTPTTARAITQDCNACHNLLAMDEAEPKILTDLGIEESTR